MATVRQSLVQSVPHEVVAQQRRPLWIRVAAAAGGSVAALAGLVLLAVAPELGVPLLLIGLRLLAMQFAWAARAHAAVSAWFDTAMAWLAGKPRWLRWLILAGIAAVAVGLVLLIISL
ncbi:hypothetical protein [Nocardia huaxiensis]|uniref:TIGR02611 family protein n=1 Tax=Nocardia huaxiensis TaxID=2755382 RepID=A0A7D6Z9I3_9NOCA|nr:hypothetical protein [Nocardia huaxiensis]QLY28318.1 hypothetical protein H0264_23390 [Nocardia huaxiensis]UFS98241.1 hypothetical protein LPY97_10255 [Nocardia huaxiensis]